MPDQIKVCFNIRNILPVSPDIYRQHAGNIEKFSNETNQSHSSIISRHKWPTFEQLLFFVEIL